MAAAEGKKAEEAYAKDGTLPDPTSTDNPEFQIVLGLIRDGLAKVGAGGGGRPVGPGGGAARQLAGMCWASSRMAWPRPGRLTAAGGSCASAANAAGGGQPPCHPGPASLPLRSPRRSLPPHQP